MEEEGKVLKVCKWMITFARKEAEKHICTLIKNPGMILHITIKYRKKTESVR